MKKYTLVLIALILIMLNQAVISQTWRHADKGSFPGFNDIAFISPNTGFAVGLGGAIYKSTDAGITWEQKQSNTNVDLHSVYFLNESTGFVGASSRKYLKTLDGGETWTVDSVLTIPSADGNIYDIYFSDLNTGWIMASASALAGPGWVLRTTNGGTNWELNLTVSNNRLYAMDFYQANIGIVVGRNVGVLYYTTDGVNWNLSPTPSLGGFNYTRSDIRSVKMVSPTIAYATGWGSLVGLQPSIHLKTTDGGANWTYMTQSEANRTYDNMYGIYFKDELNGIAVGGASRGAIVVKTSDGGQNWVPVPAPFGSTISGIDGIGDKIWIAGNSGLLATSDDLGSTWDLITRMPSASLYGFTFPSENIGYAAGFDGVFIKTTNGGANWKGGYLTVGFRTLNIQDIFFLNENIGFAAHSYQMVSKTTNGGVTWNAIIPDTNAATVTSSAVFFVNENLGFVAGRVASNVDVIYRTTDGGNSWSSQTNQLARNPQSVAFSNENKGIVVADGLKAIYTTNGGINWSQSQFLNIPTGWETANLRKVIFINENDAIAVGDKIILKSRNGGATFEYIPTNSQVMLYSVAFRNDTAYAVGKNNNVNGEVWRSADQGENWFNIIDTTVINSSVSSFLYSTAIDFNGYVWVGGSASNIFTTMPEPPVSAGNDKYVVNNYRLYQNYPNPFNPNTIISFELQRSDFITLKVYDILGKKVAVLIDGMQESGVHHVNFDASNLTSGVYFYRLQAGDFVEIKKMVLLR